MEGEMSRYFDEEFVMIENYMGDPEIRIDIPQEQTPSSPPRRRIPAAPTDLPPVPDTATSSHHRLTPVRRPLKLKLPRCLVYAIPLLIVICFALLWWFSSPVNLVVKDGRLMDVHTSRRQSVSLNDTHINLERLAVLVAATPPNPTLSHTTTDKAEDVLFRD